MMIFKVPELKVDPALLRLKVCEFSLGLRVWNIFDDFKKHFTK